MAEDMEGYMVRGGHGLLHTEFFHDPSKGRRNFCSTLSVFRGKDIRATRIDGDFDEHFHCLFRCKDNLASATFCTDVQASGIVVDVIPSEMKNFCRPHSCMQTEHCHLIRLRTSGSQNIKKFLAFSWCEKTHPFIIDLGHPEHAAGFYNERIFCGSVDAYGVIDHTFKEAQSMGNTLRRKVLFEEPDLQSFGLLWKKRIYEGGVDMFSAVKIVLFEGNIDVLAKGRSPFGICIDSFLKRKGRSTLFFRKYWRGGFFAVSETSSHPITLTSGFYPVRISEFIRNINVVCSVLFSSVRIDSGKYFVKNSWISGGYEFSHTFSPFHKGKNCMTTALKDIILSFFYPKKERAMAKNTITRCKHLVGRARFERATLCLKGGVIRGSVYTQNGINTTDNITGLMYLTSRIRHAAASIFYPFFYPFASYEMKGGAA